VEKKKDRLITIFYDLTVEDVLKLRDIYNKTFVHELNINGRVKRAWFEFTTEGLVFGKVLGKKAYRLRVPIEAYNSVVNSKIRLDKIIVRDDTGEREVSINWPEFWFVNPDKVTVKIAELRKKQRKGWKGKAFKQIFWDWDGAVNVWVYVEMDNGMIGYEKLTRIVFVYKGNRSANIVWANQKRRELKARVKRILAYIRTVYGQEVEALTRRYVHAVLTGKNEDVKEILDRMAELLNRNAIKTVFELADTIIRLKKELNEAVKLMNRNSGAEFMVIVEYDKLYMPVKINGDIKNDKLRFYTAIAAGRTEQIERWRDSFGNQVFILTSKPEQLLAQQGYNIAGKITEYTASGKFKFKLLGMKGPLKHIIKATGIPPKNITVEAKEQASAHWLWRNIKPSYSNTTKIAVYRAEKDGTNYIVYVVTPESRDGRYIFVNMDHRKEGKDRVFVHCRWGKSIVFIHRI